MKKLLLALSIFILGLVIWFSNPLEVFSALAKADIRYIVLGFVLSNISKSLSAAKWFVLLDNRKIKFRDLVPVQLFGIAVSNLTPGKLAEPVKAIVVKMRTGMPVSSVLPTIIWERVNDVIVLLILASVALFSLRLESQALSMSLFGVSVFISVIIFALGILNSRKFGEKVFSVTKKLPIMKNISEGFVRTFYKSKIRKRKIALSFCITSVAWVLEGFIIYFSFMALGINSNPLLLAGILALAALIGIASTLPGGIGSSDAVMIFLVTLTGVPAATAAAGVLLSRFISFWYGMALGGLSFMHLSKSAEIKNLLK